ncbi:MAG TPA: RluA family pseudouridine synthase, partial [Polyangiaceae bacterium]|nr:RluA family pseudouridine synthase [Polyangiaceae bacterium]
MSARRVELEAHEADSGDRLDKFLARHVPGLGRHQAAELCSQGRARIDGHRARKSALVHAGAKITIELDDPESLQPEPELALDLRLERPEFVVVNKPAGMPTAPLDTRERGTLCGALLARYPEMQGVGHRAREPGIVHRLDTQTSGLVLAARSAQAFTRLNQALEREELQKRYLAIVSAAGLAESGEISRPLAPDPAHPERVRVLEAGDRSGYARHKITRYRVKRIVGERALLELEVGSAFRHQIRAHLAAIGHPIAADAVYGGESVPELGTRHALHASQLSWGGAATMPGFTIYEPLPPDLAAL